jgi:hypothetical protein
MEWVAFALAVAAVLMGLIVSQPLALFEIGNPFRIRTELAAP